MKSKSETRKAVTKSEIKNEHLESFQLWDGLRFQGKYKKEVTN